MSLTKHLPIQPYPGIHNAGAGTSDAAVNDHVQAHDHSGNSKSGGKGSAKGLTIRTSRHWVLPPRPKPGRKPNHNHTQENPKKKKQSQPHALAQTPAPAAATQIQTPAPAPGQQDKPCKIILKREINSIKLENNKLKLELGQLVDSLQDLKQKYNTAKQQEKLPKAKSKPKSKKRQYLDDSTFAFLKFEDDNEDSCKDQDDLILPLLVANTKMNSTPSMSSCKTLLTDDEDLLTVSSSTPNSLFSSDLQHSSSLSSASSISVNNNVGCGSAHIHANHESPVKNTINDLRFLDDYEQMEFYDKYVCADPAQQPQQQQKQQEVLQPQLQSLDSIKEEEADFPLMSIASQDNDNILNFLQNNDNELPSFNESPNQVCDDLFFSGKRETDGLFQHLSAPDSSHAAATTASTANFYMPPSLEELMEEQDGGAKNFSMIDNNDDDLHLHNYDDDFDMLKVEVFDLVN